MAMWYLVFCIVYAGKVHFTLFELTSFVWCYLFMIGVIIPFITVMGDAK